MGPWLALFLLGAQAPSQPALTREGYFEMVARYRRGELDPGIAESLLSSRRDVKRVVDGVLRTPLSNPDAKAAVLMHTETAFLFAAPGSEETRDLQMEAAEKILVVLVADEDFERRWRLLAAYLYQSVLSPTQATHHLRQLPESPETLMAKAMVHEVMGAFELALVPRWDVSFFNLFRRERRALKDHQREGRRELLEAVGDYTSALDKEPGSALARLRRGRCLHLLSESDRARRDLESALSLSPTEYESGLAHLFLGQISGELRDYQGAASHYRAALDGLPRWQSVYFGLSYALQESGDVAGSQAALSRALEIHVQPNDPRGGIWQYYLRVDEFLERLGALRAEVLER